MRGYWRKRHRLCVIPEGKRHRLCVDNLPHQQTCQRGMWVTEGFKASPLSTAITFAPL